MSIKSYFKTGTLFAIVIASTTNVFGQMKPQEEYMYYKSKYPDESAIYTKNKETINYSLQNDTIVCTIEVYSERILLSDNHGIYASDKVYSSSFHDIEKLEAYTLVPDKRKYQKVEVKEFKESFDKNSDSFYDDTKETSFNYPAMQKGAKSVLKYTMVLKEPRLVHPFFFDTYIPVVESAMIVNFDNGIKVNNFVFNPHNIKIDTFSYKLKDGQNQLVFKSVDVDKIKFDTRDPSYTSLATKVYCPIREYVKSDGEKVEIVSTSKNLHKWYRTFLKDLSKKDPYLEELVSTIVKSSDSELEKVKKIYYWIQDNIKYIAFEDGMRGFVPHPGRYVIEKRYGDCKDMTSAIVSMLREAGINAHYSWIGTRDLPYKYSETPSSIVDNHMIATWFYKGKTYFLDATGQYTPLGLPTSMIQGKECLVSENDSTFQIVNVPVMPRERNTMIDSVNIRLENGQVVGTGLVTFTGYAKVFNSYRLIKSTQKHVDDYVNKLLEKGNNKFKISSYEINHVDDLSVPTTLSYDFTINDYYRQIGDNIYINPVLDKTMTDALIENRTVPVENEYKYIGQSIVQVQIPEGYKVEEIPKDSSAETNFFNYSISYHVGTNTITVKKEFSENYLLLEPKLFDSWNEVISSFARDCRKVIILKQTDKSDE